MQPAGFKSAESQTEFVAIADRIIERWPEHQTKYVTTRFGATYVVSSGPNGAAPLILVPGMNGGGSITWFANVAELSRNHRVYAIDTVGVAGRSVPTEPMRSRDDAVAWLAEVADGLQIDAANWAGHGQGAWLIMQLAMLRPERVRALVLLDPPNTFAGLAKAKIVSAIFPFLFPTAERMRPLLIGHGERTASADLWVDAVCLGMRRYRTAGKVMPALCSDEDLRRIAAPTLLLMGEDSPSAAAQSISRARRVMPGISAAVLPHTGHVVMVERSAEVNQRVQNFLR